MHNHSSNNIYKCGNEPARSLWHTEIISFNFLFDLIPKYYKKALTPGHMPLLFISTFKHLNLIKIWCNTVKKSQLSHNPSCYNILILLMLFMLIGPHM